MRFGIVELSLGMVVKTGRSFERMKEEVESSQPSRWDNPVLVVLPDKWRAPHEEGEVPFDYIESNVVAVPMSGWGYGAEYAGFVNRNRKYWGLPGTFEPLSGMLRTISFRESVDSFEAFLKMRPLIGEPESAEGLREAGETIEKLSEVKKEEVPIFEEALEVPRKDIDLIRHSQRMARYYQLAKAPYELFGKGEITYEESINREKEIEEQLDKEFGKRDYEI